MRARGHGGEAASRAACAREWLRAARAAGSSGDWCAAECLPCRDIAREQLGFGGRIHDTEHRHAILDQRDVHREVAALAE